MLDAADLRFLQSLAEAASLAAAARRLDVSPPAVSQRLALLEQRLHLRLVERGRGPLRLTVEGAIAIERGAAILADLQALTEELAARAGRIEGPLQVVASFGFGRLKVAPLLGRFARLHPDLRPALTLSEDPLGILRGASWDLLIHVGRLPDLGIVQRKLAANRRFLVAAPAYTDLNGLPGQPDDLARHRIGVVREDQADASRWLLTGPGGGEVSQRVRPTFSSNDGEVIRSWALEGMGIIERSEWSVAEDLAAGRLLRILPDWTLADADIVALLNPREVRAARVDAFADFLAENLRQVP